MKFSQLLLAAAVVAVLVPTAWGQHRSVLQAHPASTTTLSGYEHHQSQAYQVCGSCGYGADACRCHSLWGNYCNSGGCGLFSGGLFGIGCGSCGSSCGSSCEPSCNTCPTTACAPRCGLLPQLFHRKSCCNSCEPACAAPACAAPASCGCQADACNRCGGCGHSCGLLSGLVCKFKGSMHSLLHKRSCCGCNQCSGCNSCGGEAYGDGTTLYEGMPNPPELDPAPTPPADRMEDPFKDDPVSYRRRVKAASVRRLLPAPSPASTRTAAAPAPTPTPALIPVPDSRTAQKTAPVARPSVMPVTFDQLLRVPPQPAPRASSGIQLRPIQP